MTLDEIRVYRVAYRAAWTAAREHSLWMTGTRADSVARFVTRDESTFHNRLNDRATRDLTTVKVQQLATSYGWWRWTWNDTEATEVTIP